jgi:hypothetical protein
MSSDPVALILYPPPHRSRVSAISASQQQVASNHWSHRVTDDNPHGLIDRTLVRLRAIEDPDEREKEEKKVLAMKRTNEKRYSNAEAAARKRDRENERKRKKKINAGYVISIAVLSLSLRYRFNSFIFSFHPQLSRTHTLFYSLESVCIRRQPAWIQRHS